MTRFRKRPVEVAAVQFDGTELTRKSVALFLSGEGRWKEDPLDGGYIPTLEGEMEFKPGDWIIYGVKGEYYPCKPDVFDLTYERVTTTQTHSLQPGP